MHVLQLVPSLRVGGVERGVLDVSKGLITRGHRVSVVSSGGPLVERLTQLGATHYHAPVHEKSPATMWSCVPLVVQIIRSTGVDVVHARSRVPGWIGWLATRRAQRPFVTTAHGFYAPHAASRVMVWGRLVITPSDVLGRYLIETFGLPRERLRVIPRGVDLQEFAVRPPRQAVVVGPWRIGLFGRLSPLKGQDVALEACAELIRRRVPVTLCLAGDTPESPGRRALEALIRSRHLEQAVEWWGVRDDMASAIADVDCVVMPSTYPESFGRSAIEAQAVGRPVVASRVGALPELIDDGVTGWLVPPRDPIALADAVERLVKDPAVRTRCVETARRRVEERWNLDRMVDRTLAVYDECLSRPRVLVWKLSALGDVILSVPSLRALRRQFPQGHITLVTGRSAYEVVARCPYVDDIIIHDPRGKHRSLGRFVELVRRVRQLSPDLSVDFQNNHLTHLLAWLSGAAVRIGYRRKLGRLLNRAVRLPRKPMAPVAHQHHLLREAGLSIDTDALELWPTPREEAAAQRLLDAAPGPGSPGGARVGRQQVVGVHPGGSGRWRTKRWDLARWASVCDALAERGVRVVAVGGPEERALGAALMALTKRPPMNAIGQTTVMELAGLIKRCDVFLAHDSSSLHVAAAVGTPTVALFGPTDPRRHLPPQFNGQVLKKDVFCSPCYSPRCRTITHACMKRIGVEEVLQTVFALLADAETRHARTAG